MNSPLKIGPLRAGFKWSTALTATGTGEVKYSAFHLC
jgi:hypothetical protein